MTTIAPCADNKARASSGYEEHAAPSYLRLTSPQDRHYRLKGDKKRPKDHCSKRGSSKKPCEYIKDGKVIRALSISEMATKIDGDCSSIRGAMAKNRPYKGGIFRLV